MKTKLFLTTSCAFLLSVPATYAYDKSWDGNHPNAQSEAWTWMGHLQMLETDGGKSRLGRDGVGFLYYYTRNQTNDMGALNFRSSALTVTKDGVGQSFSTDTIYEAQVPGATMKTRANALDIAFQAGRVQDRVVAESMTAADLQTLNDTLPLFPGLRIAPRFTPRKINFQVTERDGSRIELKFYSIWPVVSPPDGKMTFLGQANTYSFSDPMMVTVGTYKGRKVAGLSFMDRQWATQYFGVVAQAGLSDLLKYAHALRFSHSWSAFHAYNETRKEWSFFHIWRQFERQDGKADRLADYSGILWTRSGTQSGMVQAKDYTWKDSGYVQQQGAKVLLDYANDRYGFFPSRAEFGATGLGFKATLQAGPSLQSLGQPIPFFEGYAEGSGTWNGDKVRLQGRLESSRLMFRDQDYVEMAQNLASQTDPSWRQTSLQQWLSATVAQNRSNPFKSIGNPLAVFASLLSSFDLKMAIFGKIISGAKPQTDPQDPAVTIY